MDFRLDESDLPCGVRKYAIYFTNTFLYGILALYVDCRPP